MHRRIYVLCVCSIRVRIILLIRSGTLRTKVYTCLRYIFTPQGREREWRRSALAPGSMRVAYVVPVHGHVVK